jgi:hypothetical protein
MHPMARKCLLGKYSGLQGRRHNSEPLCSGSHSVAGIVVALHTTFVCLALRQCLPLRSRATTFWCGAGNKAPLRAFISAYALGPPLERGLALAVF